MKLTWTKTEDGWFAIWGQFRAEVDKPKWPLGFYHWGVKSKDQNGGSGGTSSAAGSKKAAENELERFAEWLRTQRGKS